jgi:hypothetical protein
MELTSPSLHPTTSSNRLLGITECGKLKVTSLHQTHGITSTSNFINFRLPSIHEMHLVGHHLCREFVPHARKIMGSGVITIAPHEFKQLSSWHY